MWFVAPRHVEIRAQALPPLQDGDVLVRTLFSGISAGTELLAYRGELSADLAIDETLGALSGTFRYPYQYGYSCVGIVEQTRSKQFAEGTTVFSFHPHQDVFVANARDVVAVPPDLARQSTLFPLVETALQITLDAGPLLGETVCVFGLGSVGALTAWMIGRAGARAIGVEPHQWRREAVADLGIEAVAPDELRPLLNADGQTEVHLVVEASGNPAVLRSSLDLLAHEGTVLVASWYGTKEVSLPLGAAFHRRRLTIRSTQVSTIPARLSGRWTLERRRSAAVDFLREPVLDRLATDTVPFARAADAYATLDAGTAGVTHIALGYT